VQTPQVDSDRLLVVFTDGSEWRPGDFASSPKRRGVEGSVGWIVDHANAELAQPPA
jgi:hypothetical protein